MRVPFCSSNVPRSRCPERAMIGSNPRHPKHCSEVTRTVPAWVYTQRKRFRSIAPCCLRYLPQTAAVPRQFVCRVCLHCHPGSAVLRCSVPVHMIPLFAVESDGVPWRFNIRHQSIWNHAERNLETKVPRFRRIRARKRLGYDGEHKTR